MAGDSKWLPEGDDYPGPGWDDDPLREALEDLDEKGIRRMGLITVSPPGQLQDPDFPMPLHECEYMEKGQVVVIQLGEVVDEAGCCLVCGEDLNYIGDEMDV